MGVLSLRLDDELDARLSREARRENRSRSELAREALGAFLRERERQRFIDEVARAARALDPAESRTMAEEALPSGNEALLASEPRTAYRAARSSKGRPKGTSG